MLILGLSSFKHDAAAALLDNGAVRAAIENDKLVRSRTTGLPENAIRFCLDTAGARWDDLDAIAVASRPLRGWARRSLLRARLSPFSPLGAAYHEANELGMVARELQQVRTLRRNSGKSNILHFEHHLCHAANAFYLSPYDRALILTLDREGDGRSGMLAVGEENRVRMLRTIPFPHSLAWIYEQVTELLGFLPHHDEHKTQWLSLEGEPVFQNVFLDMLRNPKNHLPRLNYSYVNRELAGRLAFSAKFYESVGIRDRKASLSDDQRRALASSLQAAITEVIASLLAYFRERTGIENVCLGGGLFLNTLLVASLERRLGLNQVFVPPAPGDSGNAVGAAALAWHQTMRHPRTSTASHAYWGPACSRSEIKDVLDNCKARYSLQTTEERKLDAALQLLESGKIVGWFQGAAEFGPRALGNRSLLASPWAPYVRENLNDFIKHREWFRPFAVAVPEEDCERYFEASHLCYSMNSLATARHANVLPEGFLLPGNRVRLHVVRQQSNPLFWRLLKRFGERAPAPLLVNTSFNLFGEPLVVKPRDAVRSYFCSGIDALVVDNFLLSKAATNHVFAATRAS
ncbi:MAG: carbamoyltransferase [Acidobacteriia bacterium]|nr:carbamoyltransferase [Terriglobia bacterium]